MRIIKTSRLGITIAAIITASLFILPLASSSTAPTRTQGQTQRTDLVIYVDINNTHGPWEGTLEHPYQFIQQGIDHAASHTTVFVFHGTYPEHVVIDKSFITVIGERRSDTSIDAGGSGTCVRFTQSNSILTNFTIQHSGNLGNDSGITLAAPDCLVSKNIIRDNFYGIYATQNANIIFFNNFFDNTYPAFATQSNQWDNGAAGNYWENLNRTDANENGIIDTPYNIPAIGQDRYPLIHPYGSIVNQRTGAEFITIRAAINDAGTIDHDIITVAPDTYWEHLFVNKRISLIGQDQTTTILDGRQGGTVVRILATYTTLQGFTVQNSGTLENDAGVSVENRNATLIDLLVQDNHHGVFFRSHGSQSLLSRCTVRTNAWNGVYILSTAGNKIIENTIQDNGFAGTMIYDASYNTVFHNQFLGNRLQAFDDGFNVWDNGYPSGGNHWSDYTGVDANGDGIGDTPYVIPGGVGVDRYPLMSGFQQNDTIPPTVKIVSPTNGLYIGNLRIYGRFLMPFKAVIIGSFNITVNATDQQSGIREVRFYLEDDIFNPVFIDTQPPYTWRYTTFELLEHKHTVTVFVFDNANNSNIDTKDFYHWL